MLYFANLLWSVRRLLVRSHQKRKRGLRILKWLLLFRNFTYIRDIHTLSVLCYFSADYRLKTFSYYDISVLQGVLESGNGAQSIPSVPALFRSVLPFRERNNFTQLSLVLQVFTIKRFKILFNGLNLGCILKIFLKVFANFSLDILIKYFLTKKECIVFEKADREVSSWSSPS